jgi:hypothetical protein
LHYYTLYGVIEVGFWPEDQWDYSPEAERERQRIQSERDYYNLNRKRDPIAEAAKSILNPTTFNFDLDRIKRAVESDPIPHCTTVNELEQFIKKIIKEEI